MKRDGGRPSCSGRTGAWGDSPSSPAPFLARDSAGGGLRRTRQPFFEAAVRQWVFIPIAPGTASLTTAPSTAAVRTASKPVPFSEREQLRAPNPRRVLNGRRAIGGMIVPPLVRVKRPRSRPVKFASVTGETGLHSEPAFDERRARETLDVSVRGSWIAASVGTMEPLGRIRVAGTRRGAAYPSICATVGEIDTFGACLLNKIIRQRDRDSAEPRDEALPAQPAWALAGRRSRWPARKSRRPGGARRFAAIENLGRATSNARPRSPRVRPQCSERSGEALLRVLRHPRRLRRPRSFISSDRVGLQAVPIIFLITVLIGAIIAQQGYLPFPGSSARGTTRSIWSAFSVLRELGRAACGRSWVAGARAVPTPPSSAR